MLQEAIPFDYVTLMIWATGFGDREDAPFWRPWCRSAVYAGSASSIRIPPPAPTRCAARPTYARSGDADGLQDCRRTDRGEFLHDPAEQHRYRLDFAVAFDDRHDGRQDQALGNRSTRCDADTSEAGCSWSMRSNSPAVKVPSCSTEMPTSSSAPILDSRRRTRPVRSTLGEPSLDPGDRCYG